MAIDRRYVLYAPILFGATGLLFLKSFIYARLFSVENFGAFNQAMLAASTFTSFAGGGLQLLGHKLLPQYYTRRDLESVDNLLASAITVFGLATMLGAVAIGVAIMMGALSGARAWSATLLCAAAQSIFMLRLIDIKSELRFLDHALLSTLRAIVLLTAGVAIAAATRSVAATLACEGLVTLILAAPILVGRRGAPILRKALGWHAERRWLAMNFPAALRLLWLNGTLTLLYAIDRWVGVALLSKKEYGIFALGLLVVVIFDTLQAVVNVAAYPLMGRMIAQEQYRRAFRLATLATVLVVSVTAVCYAPFVLLLDFVVQKYLPAYAAATTVIKLAVIAGALRLADFYASFAVLCNQERRLAWAFGVLTVIVAVAVSLARSFGHVHFDPQRLAIVTVGIAASGFLLNLTVATRARHRRAMLVPT
jgi:O-antigen/teichoic acid export membrane protein